MYHIPVTFIISKRKQNDKGLMGLRVPAQRKTSYLETEEKGSRVQGVEGHGYFSE